MADTGGPNYEGAISSIESGGNYGALGPKTKSGDRAYGKYQIMGNNIGPWTQEILGFKMSPQEFLGSKEAQDTVFHTKFGQYVNQYGPEGAARAWFAGPGGMNNLNAKDINGMTVGQYGQRFTNAMAPPLGMTNVPADREVTQLQDGAPTHAVDSAQSPAGGQNPTQTQQLQAGGGGGAPQTQPISGPQMPRFQPMQLQGAMRPQVNLASLQQMMAKLHPLLRGPFFQG